MSLKSKWATSTFWTGLVMLGAMWFGLQLSKEHRIHWDASQGSQYSLSIPMQQILDEIEQSNQSLRIVVFESQSSRKDASIRNRFVQDLLDEMERSSSLVSSLRVDLDRDRSVAQELGVTQYGSMVVQFNEQSIVIPERKLFHHQVGNQEVRFIGESMLQNVLLAILHPVVQVVYTLEGNGEHSLFDGTYTGLSDFHALLQSQGLQVRKLDLLKVDEVPSDAAAVLVLEPQGSLSSIVQQRLLSFVQAGGRLWLASGESNPVVLDPIFVSPLNGVVSETEVQSGHWDYPILSIQSDTSLGQLKKEGRSVVFTRSTAFELLAAPQSGIHQTVFAKLRSQAWLERGPLDDIPHTFDPDQDWMGVASLVAGVEVTSASGLLKDDTDTSRVLIMGDGDWLSNGMFAEVPSNILFAQGLLDWLFEDEDVATARYRTPNRVLLTQPQLNSLRWILLIPLPLLMSLWGFLSWRKRR